MADDTTPFELTPTSNTTRRGRGDTRSPAAPYVSPPLPSARPVTDAHREHLRRTSGLTDATIADAALWSVTTRNEAIALLGRTSNLPAGHAIAFPFFTPSTPTSPYAYRIRPDSPRQVSNGKRSDSKTPRVVKYDQPSGDIGVMVYYPPLCLAGGGAALRDTSRILYFTEGEKKALLMCQQGFVTVGLTGVWNWSDPVRRKLHGGWYLHDRIAAHVELAGRDVVIVFDNDAWDKADVMRAARKLSGVLLEAGARSVRFTTPPARSAYKGIDDYYVGAGAELFAATLTTDARELSPDDPAADAAVPLAGLPALAGADLPDGLVLPRGYEVADSGRVTCHAGEKTIEVSSTPLLVVRRYADHSTQVHRADVLYRTARGWLTATVSQVALADSRVMLRELSALGLPVAGDNAKACVSWFRAYLAANDAVLPPLRSVSRTGWIGPSVFMAAEAIYAGDDPRLIPSGELAELSRALTPRGTLDGHLAALHVAWAASPTFRVALCAALAAPLLYPIGITGLAVHLCGDSSRGKSTMMRLAASVYGNPESRAWWASWNQTPNAMEMRAARMCDLPVFVDEAGESRSDPDAMQRLIYTLANGQGRARVTREITVRETLEWRTVVMSSGESPLSDTSMATGAQARVITLVVDGWGTLNGDSAAIEQLRADCEAHSGSFGCEWLMRIVAMSPSGVEAMRNEWGALRSRYRAAAGPQARIAGYHALFTLIEGTLINDYGFANDGQTVAAILTSGEQSESVSGAAEYMRDRFVDWLHAEPDAFPVAEYSNLAPGGRTFVVRAAHGYRGKRAGVRIVDGAHTEILVLRSAFNEWCRRPEYRRSPIHVLRDWHARGWIEASADGGKTRFDCLRTESEHGRSRWIVWRGESGGV